MSKPLSLSIKLRKLKHSLQFQPTLNHNNSVFILGLTVLLSLTSTSPPANNQGAQVPSSTHALSRVSPQARRTRRPRRGDYVRVSKNLPSRSMTSPIPRSRRPVAQHKLEPAFSDCNQGKAPTGARSVPSMQSLGELTIERSVPNSHTTALREAIRSTQESIKHFLPSLAARLQI
jgi:hypothetical protein